MKNARSSLVLGDQLSLLYNLGAAGTLTDGQLLDRFLARSDPAASEAAFAVLVERHGAMVLSICQQLLGNSHDAHDAFQATFLVLVNKAGSIRNRESVGGWLFRIARRVAARAQVEAARRRRHLQALFENKPASGDNVEIMPTIVNGVDYKPLIDEVNRLPELLRSPVVLHYFEGLSTEATAIRLGCSRGTILSRLSRARRRIKERLEHRGVSFAALIPTGNAWNRWIPPTPAPAGLAERTVRAAGSLGLGNAAIESTVPAAVATLSRGIARSLVLSELRVGASIFLLAVVGVSIGLPATFTPDEPQRAGARPNGASPPRGAVEKDEPLLAQGEVKGQPVIFRGRVVDPDGKPVAGAEILLGLAIAQDEQGGTRRVAASGPDGRFEVAVPRMALDRSEHTGGDPPVLAALIPGFGPDWIKLTSKGARDELNIRLRRDDVPIEGRIIDLEGRPVAGVDVNVLHIWHDPPDFLKRARENGEVSQGLWNEAQNGLFLEKPNPNLHARTDRDGRFRLTGVGRDRRITLSIHGGAIERSIATIFTTRDPAYIPLPLPVDESDNSRNKLLGPRFDLTVPPGRVIGGVIRDAETGRPVPGARIRSWESDLGSDSPLSDAQGRFRLTGLSMNKEHRIEVVVDGQSYIKVVKVIGNPTGPEPIAVDINLRRGLVLEGKVTNRETGRPVRAVVQYYPFRDNPHLKEYPDASFFDNALFDEAEFRTDENGHFRAFVLPGGGILAVRAPDLDYLTAEPLAPHVAANVLWISNFADDMISYEALVPIDRRDGVKSVVADIKLAPGIPQRVQVGGPAERPISGTRVYSVQSRTTAETVPGSDFTFVHRNPGKAERVVVLQQDQGLGTFVDIQGNEPAPIRVQLQPTGTIIGRLVDEDGQARPNIPLSVIHLFKRRGERIYMGILPEGLTTGPDGRFRITNLVPRIPFLVEVHKKNAPRDDAEGYLKGDTSVKPGEVQDWGDVQAKHD